MRAAIIQGGSKRRRKNSKQMPNIGQRSLSNENASHEEELDGKQFWVAVEDEIKRHSGKDAESPILNQTLSRASSRRPSLQITERLMGIGDKLGIDATKLFCIGFVLRKMSEIKVIMPDHHLKVKWDVLLGVLILYSVIIIPLNIGFDIEPTSDSEIREILIDCMFGLDIVVSFDTAYVGANDEMVTDRRKIAKEYCDPFKGWFLVDFLSTVPIDKVVKSFQGGDAAKETKAIKLLRLARLMKLTRVIKLGKFKKNLDMDSINPAAFGLISLLCKIAFTGESRSVIRQCGDQRQETYSFALSLPAAPRFPPPLNSPAPCFVQVTFSAAFGTS